MITPFFLCVRQPRRETSTTGVVANEDMDDSLIQRTRTVTMHVMRDTHYIIKSGCFIFYLRTQKEGTCIKRELDIKSRGGIR